MSIQDSSPERRNLTVMSLAIIVYYLAGGQFSEDEVKLLIVNIKFEHPLVLTFFVWIIFAWFYFRYFMSTRKNISDSAGGRKVSAVTKFDLFPMYKKYFIKMYNDRPKKLIHELEKLDANDTRVTLAKNIYQYSNNRYAHIANVEVSNFRYLMMYFDAALRLAFKEDSITKYYAPFVLAIIALLLGFINSFLPFMVKACMSLV